MFPGETQSDLDFVEENERLRGEDDEDDEI